MKSRNSNIVALILPIFALLTITSCSRLKSSVLVPINSTRFDSPEMSTQVENVTVGLNGVTPTKLLLVPEIGAIPLVTDSVRVKKEAKTPELSFHLAVPVYKRIEVSIDIHGRVQLKSQIFGQNRRNAQTGNLSGAISVAYNHSSEKVKEVDANWVENNSHEVQYSWSLDTYHYNLVFGYRPLKNTIIYAGPRYTNYSLSGELSQYRMGRLFSDDYEYLLKGNGIEKGVGFGLEVISNYSNFQQAIAYTVTSSQVFWGNYTSNILINHGIMIKYYF